MATEQTVIKANTDRRSFINKVTMAGLTLGAGALLSGKAARRVEAQTVQNGGIIVTAAEVSFAFKEIAQDEQNHVAFLVAALGSSARPAPSFYESSLTAPAANITAFVQDAAALENTGTGAYLAATPLPAVTAEPAILQDAAEIALVEGRHAGFLNALLGRPLLTDPAQNDSVAPSPNVEVAQSPTEVLSRAAPFTGTITQAATPGATSGTSLNGGTLVGFDVDVTAASYIDILNYALFLEYLEATFYYVNVPHFFK